MFLRSKTRRKDGKEHRYWSIVENRRCHGTRWLHVFKTLVVYRLIDPGSEWRLHRQWFEQSAMEDFLGEDFALVQQDKLYRCMDRLLAHKQAFFSYLKTRWETLFNPRFDVLLYDLTSTYKVTRLSKGACAATVTAATNVPTVCKS